MFNNVNPNIVNPSQSRHDYKGSQISFNKGENVMINATQMAKPFGKRCNDFLSAKQTKELIVSLSAKTGISATGLVTVNQGGSNQGTWMHEDLALVFAQWLAPDFYLWCNDRIKELLKTGVSTVSNDDEAIAYAMSVLQKRLEKAKEEKEKLEADNRQKQETIDLQQEEIQKSAPKVSYYDQTLQSVNTMTTTQIAKQIGMAAEKLNQKLKEAGVIFRQSGQWLLKNPYAQWHMHATRTQNYTRSDGSIGTSTYTVWTERGRRFIVALSECGFNVRKAIRQIKGEFEPQHIS